LFETEKPGRDWGHAARDYAIQFISPESKYVVFGSTDNYYMPLFFEFMVKPFLVRPEIEATYCNMVHNNFAWEKMDCSIRMGRIDCGNFMTKTENARAVGWKHRHYEADWAYIQEIQQRFCKSPMSFYKVDKILFVHN
jgi:hypothetical protein